MTDPLKTLREKILGSSVMALPQTATKVLELSKNPNNGPAEYEMPIMADPGLSAQILHFANSSFFGFSHRITTVRMALTLISVRTIRNFVLWNAVFALLPNPKIGNFLLQRFFQDTLRRAVFCKVYAGAFRGLDSEHVFVAGLFQDIALPVLVQHWPEEYGTILKIHGREPVKLVNLEQEQFGWSHAVAGAMLVEEWGLDEEIVRSVANHHVQEIGRLDTSSELLEAIVRVSAHLPASEARLAWHDADRFFAMLQKINVTAKNSLKKRAPSPIEIFEMSDTQYKDMLLIGKLAAPKISLCDRLKEYSRSLE